MQLAGRSSQSTKLPEYLEARKETVSVWSANISLSLRERGLLIPQRGHRLNWDSIVRKTAFAKKLARPHHVTRRYLKEDSCNETWTAAAR